MAENQPEINEPDADEIVEPELGRDVLVFVPSFNDHAMLGEISMILTALLPQAQMLVVDDGSHVPISRRDLGDTDLLVRLPTNMGLGVATHVAIDHALRYGYQFIVRIDSDGQHPVDGIPSLLLPLRNGEMDLVSGERTNQREGARMGGFPAGLVKSYFTVLSRVLTAGRSPGDVNTGFLAMNRAAMQVLNNTNLYRFPEPQIFLTLGRARMRLTSVPIKQQPRSHGSTTLGFMQALRLFYRFNIIALNEALRRRRQL